MDPEPRGRDAGGAVGKGYPFPPKIATDTQPRLILTPSLSAPVSYVAVRFAGCQGNFGEVFKGTLQRDKTPVAVKTCKEDLPPELKIRFLSEARSVWWRYRWVFWPMGGGVLSATLAGCGCLPAGSWSSTTTRTSWSWSAFARSASPSTLWWSWFQVGGAADGGRRGFYASRPTAAVFAPGGDFLSYLRKKKDELKTKQLLRFSVDAAAGMAYLESKNCIHR